MSEKHCINWSNLRCVRRVIRYEGGYFHIQATRPDTVGYALNDSPFGLSKAPCHARSIFSTCSFSCVHSGEMGSLEQHPT